MSLLILADSLYFCLSVRQTINSMKKIFLAVATALAMFSCSQKEPVTVTITNPLSIDRNGEMVEISMAEITGKLQLPDTAQDIVLDENGLEVPYQITYVYNCRRNSTAGGCGCLWASISRASG